MRFKAPLWFVDLWEELDEKAEEIKERVNPRHYNVNSPEFDERFRSLPKELQVEAGMTMRYCSTMREAAWLKLKLDKNLFNSEELEYQEKTKYIIVRKNPIKRAMEAINKAMSKIIPGSRFEVEEIEK